MNTNALLTVETPVECAWCIGKPSKSKVATKMCPKCYDRMMTQLQGDHCKGLPKPVVLMSEAQA